MMNKRLKEIGFFIVFAIVAIWLVVKIQSLPSFTSFLKPKEVIIAASPVAVKQIQALAQLVTISLYEEIVVDSNVNNDEKIHLPLLPDIALLHNQNTLVMVGTTTTQVGIDMQRMSNSSITATKDSIHIVLPVAQVLDVIINPSATTIFIEKGVWNNEAIILLKNKIKTIAMADAQSRGLLAQSEAKAREIFTRFFMAAGYKKVTIEFQQNAIRLN